MDNIKESTCPLSESASLEKLGNDTGSSSPSISPKNGPSNWPEWLKRLVLFEVVAQVFMASWCAPAFIPAFLTMSQEMNKSISAISYLVGGYALLLGFGVLLWNPLADRFGRRPVTIVSMIIAVCASCGVASARSYGNMMAGRILQGFGVCGGISLGIAYINDMYNPSDKGRAVGVWTLGITVGPFLSPLLGGFIAYYTSYRWILWLCAILLGALLLLQIACLPEAQSPPSTVFSFPSLVDFAIPRGENVNDPPKQQSPVFDSLARTYRAALLIPVWLVGMAFVVPYCYVVVSLTNLFPVIYGEVYGFDERAQGLLYIPFLVGSLIAEAFTGRAGDWIVYRGRGTTGVGEQSDVVLERRLILAYGGTVVSIVGLLWFGLTAERHDHWAILAVGSGVAACGVQIVASVCYSYIVDCYPESAKEVATVMNLFRSLGSFIVLFYNQQMNDTLGEGWGFGLQCFMVAFFSFGGLGIISFYGQRIRSLQK